MLKAGALMATLLVLVQFTGSSIRGRLLVLCEVWPGHLKEYQQESIVIEKNDSFRTSVSRILEPSTLKKDSRNYNGFRTNFKTCGKDACKKRQQKNILKHAILYKRNQIANKKRSIQIAKKHLLIYKVFLREKKYLRSTFNTLLNARLEDYEVKMNWHLGVRKNSEGNKTEQFQVSHIENGYKYMRTRSSLCYTAYQTLIIVKGKEDHFLRSLKILGSIIKLNFVNLQKDKTFIETMILQRKKCKNNFNRMFCSVKKKFCKMSTNVYRKNQDRILSDGKVFNVERGQYIGLRSLQQESNIKEKIKMWNQKTVSKKLLNENQKLLLRHVITYQQNSYSLQKIYSAHKIMLSNIQGKQSVFEKNPYKHLIQKWGNIFRAKKICKFVENGMGTLLKRYYMQPFIIDFNFLAITTYVKQELFSSEKYQINPLVSMKNILKYLLQSSERVKKKYFCLGQKGLKTSIAKALMEKHLGKKEIFPAFYKDIFNSPSIVERTKRSTERETVSISVDVLQRLSSALIAGATLFGIALFMIALAGFYLYLKRREVCQFFSIVSKNGKSYRKPKSIDSQSYAPISVSQNFHIIESKDLRKKQRTEATAFETCSRENSDLITIRAIYDSSDTEESPKMSHRGLTVRSRAYVFPSQSNGSIQSFCDDVCSMQLSLSDEIIMENLGSKEIEPISIASQPNHSSSENQNHQTNSEELPQLKRTISKSKSENDIIRAASANTLRPIQSLTDISKEQKP